jgi:alpha-1,2-mannosyltransferase
MHIADSVAARNPTHSHHHTVNVCTGGEWYQFPSHFFLPPHARLQYIDDHFGGILPQHFAPLNGTAAVPLQAFNNRNREEKARYVPLLECDYLVLLMHEDGTGLVQERLRTRGGEGFRRVLSEKVISAADSAGAGLYRAFYVPFRSSAVVKTQDYVLFEKIGN